MLPADGVNKEGDNEGSTDGAAQVDAGQHIDPLLVSPEVVQLPQVVRRPVAGELDNHLHVVLLLLGSDDLGGTEGGPAHQEVRFVECEAGVRSRGQD